MCGAIGDSSLSKIDMPSATVGPGAAPPPETRSSAFRIFMQAEATVLN